MADDNRQRMQPLVAARALKTLINDPERTEQVFVIIRAMSGNSLQKAYARFRTTGTGQLILAENRQLLETLQNREALKTLPPGSLGRAYLQFVESENISADGLVAASNYESEMTDPGFHLYANRMRDMHDLWHVVTGYGRDTFGEACLLAFTYAQTRNRGVGIIALVAMIKLSREIGAGVRGAVWQAYRAGRNAAWMPAQDWEALLAQPLESVRHHLNIQPPGRYQTISSQMVTA
jgi:ubiquinone biosynthesis protein COQ4